MTDIVTAIAALIIALVALILATGALGIGLVGRRVLARELDDVRAALAGTQQVASTAQQETASLQQQVAELKSLAEAPPPPLPRARSGRLDDLRAQLRASQSEGGDEDDAEV
jgi:hypothetical protein